MLARVIAVVAALVLGWIIYMIGMVLTVYDGMLSLIFQPFMAALVSGICVATALLLGLLFRIPVLAQWWTGSSLWAALIAAVSLFVLAFGYFVGLTYVGVHPETGSEVVILHPAAVAAGYFFFLFAIANWPIRTVGR